jgi:hypothetical protein
MTIDKADRVAALIYDIVEWRLKRYSESRWFVSGSPNENGLGTSAKAVGLAGARYARHRAQPDERNLVFRSIRLVFWLAFEKAA